MKKPWNLILLFLAGLLSLSSCIKEDISGRAVGDTGPEVKSGSVLLVPYNYPTIQSAIDQAFKGDIIRVSPGVYAEQVEIRDLDNIRVEGEDATITVPVSGLAGSLVKIF